MQELIARFPWLGFLKPTADRIIDTLMVKERHYAGSWQRRGGIGAFMMMARKWDRVESIASRHRYDLFDASAKNDGDVLDDIDDLIGYLLLVRAEVDRRAYETPELPLSVGEPVFSSVRTSVLPQAQRVDQAEPQDSKLPADQWDNQERDI